MMKYVLGHLVVVLLVRIDFFLKLFDSASDYSKKEAAVVVDEKDLQPGQEIVTMAQDKTLQVTAKKKLLSLLEDFKSNPEEILRAKIIQDFKANPHVFTQKLDKDFESILFGFRDLLSQKNPQLIALLVDLDGVLLGENQAALRKFFSLLSDIQMDLFLRYYSLTKDVNCLIMATLADPVPAYDELSVFEDRDAALTAVLASESMTLPVKTLATNCQVIVRSHLMKITPPPAPETNVNPQENTEPVEESP